MRGQYNSILQPFRSSQRPRKTSQGKSKSLHSVKLEGTRERILGFLDEQGKRKRLRRRYKLTGIVKDAFLRQVLSVPDVH